MIFFLKIVVVVFYVIDLYDYWLVHWRVCGSVVINVEN
jgi:hypothetical protein